MGSCVTVTVFGETPEAETATIALLVVPVMLAAAVMVKLLSVVPLVGDSVSQETPSVTDHDKTLLLPQFVTLINLEPPSGGGIQESGETQRIGGFGSSAVTCTILLPPFDVISILPVLESGDITALLMETSIRSVSSLSQLPKDGKADIHKALGLSS